MILKDNTLEIDENDLKSVLLHKTSTNSLSISTNKDSIKDSNVYIITVPTPIDKHNRPVLTPMIKATETVCFNIKKRRYSYL